MPKQYCLQLHNLWYHMITVFIHVYACALYINMYVHVCVIHLLKL